MNRTDQDTPDSDDDVLRLNRDIRDPAQKKRPGLFMPALLLAIGLHLVLAAVLVMSFKSSPSARVDKVSSTSVAAAPVTTPHVASASSSADAANSIAVPQMSDEASLASAMAASSASAASSAAAPQPAKKMAVKKKAPARKASVAKAAQKAKAKPVKKASSAKKPAEAKKKKSAAKKASSPLNLDALSKMKSGHP